MTTDSDAPSSKKLRDEFPEGYDDETAMNAQLRGMQESDALAAIVKALRERQEYDAGNAILFLSQTGLLSRSGLTTIADLVLDDFSLFQSKIGALIYPKICRSIGMWMLKNGEAEKGDEMLKRGFLCSLWRGRLQGWSKCKYRDQFPECIEKAIGKVE